MQTAKFTLIPRIVKLARTKWYVLLITSGECLVSIGNERWDIFTLFDLDFVTLLLLGGEGRNLSINLGSFESIMGSSIQAHRLWAVTAVRLGLKMDR